MRPAIAAACAVAWLAACTAMDGGPSQSLVTGPDWSELEPIEMRGIDYAAVDPLADFATYTRVIIDPVEVSFPEDWPSSRPGSSFKPAERDVERLRQEIAAVVYEGFVDEIREGERYQLVEDAGPGTLRIHAQLVDVRLNAPNFPTPGRTEQFARSAGEWTLVAELVDAESGAVVARLVDRWVDREEPQLRWMTRADNVRALWRATETWARAVRRHLDVAGIRSRMEGIGEGLRPTGGG